MSPSFLDDRKSMIALCVSVIMHAVVIYPWPWAHLFSQSEISFRKIELTYYSEEPVNAVIVKDKPPIHSIKAPAALGIKNKAGTSHSPPAPAGTESNATPDKRSAPHIRPEKKDALAAHSLPRTDIIDLGAPITSSFSEPRESARLRYFLGIRDTIKDILKKNTPRIHNKGEMRVTFVVKRDGSLGTISVTHKSPGLPVFLETVALESIRQAAPFSAFEDSMTEAQLIFRLPIRFTYRQ